MRSKRARIWRVRTLYGDDRDPRPAREESTVEQRIWVVGESSEAGDKALLGKLQALLDRGVKVDSPEFRELWDDLYSLGLVTVTTRTVPLVDRRSGWQGADSRRNTFIDGRETVTRACAIAEIAEEVEMAKQHGERKTISLLLRELDQRVADLKAHVRG